MSSMKSAIRIDGDDDSVVDLTDDKPTKKPKYESTSSMSPTEKPSSPNFLIPFHLYDTKMSIYSSQSATRHPSAKKYFRTLRETIGFDAPSGSSSKDKKFQWLIACNYCFDINFFLQATLPDILSFRRVVVFYGDAGADNGSSGKMYWKELLKGSGNTVEFVRLIPSDPPRSVTNPLDVKIPYGVHHTKMFLVGYDERQQNSSNGLGGWHSMIRVVVHTANMMKQDVEWKSQGLYSQDFPLKSNTSSQPEKQQAETTKPAASAGKRGWPFEDEDPQPFEDDLVSYLESYRYLTRQPWCTMQRTTSGSCQSKTLSDNSMSLLSLIRQYDFSRAYAVLIPSIPGKHPLTSDFGYLKLRKAIQEHVIAHRGNSGSTGVSTADSKPSACQASSPIICQFSSMGSLSPKWLDDFINALDANGSNEVQNKKKKPEIQLEQKVKLVWPTVDEIRNSVEGYRGGGSVPATSRNVNKDFLVPLYHRWSKDRVNENNNNADPLGMSKNVPHIKTFLQFTSCANDDTAPSIEWLCLTSHNLSKAAWGEVQNSIGSTTKVLFIRHWELGVFISPSTLAKSDSKYKSSSVCLRPYVGSSLNGGPISIVCGDDKAEEEVINVTVPIPYDAVNPTKYNNRDIPWTIDGAGKVLPDAFGNHG